MALIHTIKKLERIGALDTDAYVYKEGQEIEITDCDKETFAGIVLYVDMQKSVYLVDIPGLQGYVTVGFKEMKIKAYNRESFDIEEGKNRAFYLLLAIDEAHALVEKRRKMLFG